MKRAGWIILSGVMIVTSSAEAAGNLTQGWKKEAPPVLVYDSTPQRMLLVTLTNSHISDVSYLSLMTVRLTGDVLYTDVAQARVYRADYQSDGEGGVIESLTLLTMGTFGSNNIATLGGTGAAWDSVPAGNGKKTFLIALSLLSTAGVGKRIGLQALTLLCDQGLVPLSLAADTGVNQLVGSTAVGAVLGFFGDSSIVGDPVVTQLEPGMGSEWAVLLAAGRGGFVGWTSLRLSATAPGDIEAVRLYRQGGGDLSRLDATDTSLAAATFGSGGMATLTFALQSILSTTRQWYLLTVTLKSVSQDNQSLSAGLLENGWIGAGGGGMVSNPPRYSRSFTMRAAENLLEKRSVTRETSPLAPPALLQNQTHALIRFSLWNRSVVTPARLTLLAVSLASFAEPGDVVNVRWYKDDGDRVFETGEDTVLDAAVFQADRLATLGNPSLASDTIPAGGGGNYYIALSLVSDPATRGKPVGLRPLWFSWNGWVMSFAYAEWTGENHVIGSTSVADAVVGLWGGITYAGSPAVSLADPQNEVELFSGFMGGAVSTTWTSLALSYTGALPSDLQEVALYKQGTGDKRRWDVTDTPVTSAPFDGAGMVTLEFYEPVDDSTRQWYLVTARVQESPTVSNVIGVTLASSAWVGVSSGSVVSSAPQGSRQYTITPTSVVTVTAESLAPLSVTQSVDLPQERVPFLRITMKADVGEAIWTTLIISYKGSAEHDPYFNGSNRELIRFYLYKDTGDGLWQSDDESLSKAAEGGLYFNNLNQVIGTLPLIYHLVVGVRSAEEGKTVQLSLETTSFQFAGATDAVSSETLPVGAGPSTVIDRPDSLAAGPVQASSVIGRLWPGGEEALLNFRLGISEGVFEKARWRGLTVSLTGNLPLEEVEAVRLFKEATGGTAWTADDMTLAAVSSFGSDRLVAFSNLNLTESSSITRYYVTAILKSTATVGLSLGVGDIAPSDFTVDAPDVGVAVVSTPAITLSPLIYVTLTWESGSPGIFQGETAPLVKISLKTNAGQAVWQSLAVSLTPGGNILPKVKLTLWADTGDGEWQALDDLTLWRLNDAVNTGTFRLTGLAAAGSRTLTTSPRVFFITASPDLDLNPVGIVRNVIVDAPSWLSFSLPGLSLVAAGGGFPVTAGSVFQDTPDQVTLSASAFLGGNADPLLAQGYLRRGAPVALLKLALANVSGDSIVLETLRVTVMGSPPQDLTLRLYKDTGVLGTWMSGVDAMVGSAVIGPDREGVFTGMLLDTNQSAILFVVAEAGPSATAGSYFGLSLIPDVSTVSLRAPDILGFNSAVWQSSTLLTVLAAEEEWVEFQWNDDVAPPRVASPGVTALLKITGRVATSSPFGDSQAIWDRLTYRVLVNASVASSVTGRLMVYRDSNANDLWDAADESLGGEEALRSVRDQPQRVLTGLAATLTAAPRVFWMALQVAGADEQDALTLTLEEVRVTLPDVVTRLTLASEISPEVILVDNPDVMTVGVEYIAPVAGQLQGAVATFMKVTLGSSEQSQTSALRVSLTGTIPPGGATVLLYRDGRENGSLEGVFEDDVKDFLRDAETLFGADRTATLLFSDFIPLVQGQNELIHNPHVYFLRLSLSDLVPDGLTVGLTLAGAEALQVVSPDTVVIQSATVAAGAASVIPVLDKPDYYTATYRPYANGRPGRQMESSPLVYSDLYVQDRMVIEAAAVTLFAGPGVPAETPAWIKLYRETTGDASWSVYDTSIGAALVNTGHSATLFNLALTLSGSNRVYVTATPGLSWPAGTTLGVGWTEIDPGAAFRVRSPDLAESNLMEKNQMLIWGVDTDFVSGVVEPIPPTSLARGSSAAFLKVALQTDDYDARFTALRVTFSGDASALTALTGYLYRDEFPFNVWSLGVDTSLSACTFGADQSGTFLNLSETIVGSSRRWFVVVKASENAPLNVSFTVGVGATEGVTVALPDRLLSLAGFASNAVSLVAAPPPPQTPLTLWVDAWSAGPVSLTQTGGPQTMLWITLRSGTAGQEVTVGDLSVSLAGGVAFSALEWGTLRGGIFDHPSNAFVNYATPTLQEESVLFFDAPILPPVTTVPKIYKLKVAVSDAAITGQSLTMSVNGADAVQVYSNHLPASGGTTFPVAQSGAIQKTSATLEGRWEATSSTAPSYLQRGKRVEAALVMVNRLTGGLPMTLTTLRLSLATSMAPGEIQAWLYEDGNGDVRWQPGDFSISAAAMDGSGGVVFENLDLSLPRTGSRNFFVVFQADAAAGVEQTLRILGAGRVFGRVSFGAPDVERADGSTFPNAGFKEMTVVEPEVDEVSGSGDDEPPDFFLGGLEHSGAWLSIAGRGGDGVVVLDHVAVTLGGSLDLSWVTLRLYRDNGNGVWDADKDASLASLASFSSDRLGTFASLQDTLAAGRYFIRVFLPAGVPAQSSQALGVGVAAVGVAPPDRMGSFTTSVPANVGTSSSPTRVTATAAGFSTTFKQGVSYNLLRLTLKSVGSGASFRGLTVSLLGEALPEMGLWNLEKFNGDGQLEWSATGTADPEKRRVVFGEFVQSVDRNFVVKFTVASTLVPGTLVGVTLMPDASSIQVNELATVVWASPGAGTTLAALSDDFDRLTNLGGVNVAPVGFSPGQETALLKLVPVVDYDAVRWRQAVVKLSGTASPALVGMRLYRETSGNQTWGSGDTLVAGGTFDLSGAGTLRELSETLVAGGGSSYYIVLSLAPGVPAGATVKVAVLGASAISLASPDMVNDGLEASSSFAVVFGNGILAEGMNFAPAAMAPGQRAAMYRISLRTIADQPVTVASAAVQLKGGLDPDRLVLYLYRDDPGALDGVWQSTDLPRGTLTGRAAFDRDLSVGVFSGLADPVSSAAPLQYFVVLSLLPDAPEGGQVGLSLWSAGWTTVPSGSMEPFALASSLVVVDSPDLLQVSGATLVGGETRFQRSSFAVFQLTVTGANAGTVSFDRIRLSLAGTVSTTLAWVGLSKPGYPVDSWSAFGVDRWGTLTVPEADRIYTASVGRSWIVSLSLGASAEVGSTVGLSISGGTGFEVTSPDVVSAPTLILSPVSVADAPDTLTVVGTPCAPAYVAAGQEWEFLRMTLSVNGDQAVWHRLDIEETGLLVPTLAAARLYRDVNANGRWDGGDTLIASSAFDLSRRGAFSGFAETLFAENRLYLVTLTLSPQSPPGISVGVKVWQGSSFSLASPDEVGVVSGLQAASSLEPADVVVLYGEALGPGVMLSGTTAPLLRLSLRVATPGMVVWSSLRISLTGPLPVGEVGLRLYKDTGDGTWNDGDPLLKTVSFQSDRVGTFSALNQTFAASSTFFVVGVHQGTVMHQAFGLTLTGLDLALVSPDVAAEEGAAGTPLIMVKQSAEVGVRFQGLGPLVLGQTSSPALLFQLTLATNQDTAVWTSALFSLVPPVASAGLSLVIAEDTGGMSGEWDDGDVTLGQASFGAGGRAVLSGWQVTLTTAARQFLVRVAPSESAPTGGLRITAFAPWWGISPLDTFGPAGGSAALSIDDSLDRLTLTAANTGPAVHRQNGERPYLALTLSVNQDEAVVTSLTVFRFGSLADAFWGTVRWYADDEGALGWHPQMRVLSEGALENGVVTLAPQGVTVSGQPLRTYLTVRLSSNAPLNAQTGLSLSPQPARVAGIDEIESFGGAASALKTVTLGTPLTLAVAGVDPSGSALQGASGVVLLTLTLSNGSLDGDYSNVTGLTLGGEDSAFSALWAQNGSQTLGIGSRVGATWSLPIPVGADVAGRPVWTVRGDLSPLAPLGVSRITLTGVALAPPDTLEAQAGGREGSVVVTDFPDALQISGGEGSGLWVEKGKGPAPLLWLTARLISSPEDRATLTALTLTLTGNPPSGESELVYPVLFTVHLFKEQSGAGLSLEEDAWVTSSPVGVSRLVVLSLMEDVRGGETPSWHVAVSLRPVADAEVFYGGTVGLSLMGAAVAGVDHAVVAAVSVSLRRVLDQVIHVVQGMLESPTAPLTLGAIRPWVSLTLASDRNTARVRSLIVSHTSVDGADSDVAWLALYRETDGSPGWSQGDASLAGGSLVSGGLSLGWFAPFEVGTTGVTLWLVSAISPFLPLDRSLSAEVRVQYAGSPSVTPSVLVVPPRAVIDAPGTLWVGATDYTSSVVVTGEAVPVARVSLSAATDGVGVTRVGVRVGGTTNALLFLNYLNFELREGNRVLAAGGVSSADPVRLNLTFLVRETVWREPRYWDVYLTGRPGAPSNEFRVLFDPADQSLQGAQDVVTGSGMTSGLTQLISNWGFATVRLSHVAMLASPGDRVAPGAVVPLARLAFHTVEPGSVARWTKWRLGRVGKGLPKDARVAVYASRDDLSTFDGAIASPIGSGAFEDRQVTVTLINKPFLTNVPKVFWLVAEIQRTALTGATWGLDVDQRSFMGEGVFEIEADRFPLRTPLLTIESLVGSTLSAELDSASAQTLVQGAVGVTLGAMTVRTTDGPGSVVTGLQVSLVSGADALTRLRMIQDNGMDVTRGVGPMLGGIRITLGEPATSVPVGYWLVGDVPMSAPVGATLQVAVGSDGVRGPERDVRVVNGGVEWRSSAFRVRDAPDQLTLSARPRPVPWEVSEWTPAFLITLNVDHDEAQLIRMTLGSFGNWLTGELDNFRLRIGDTTISTVAQSLGGGLMQLSLVNYPVTKLSSYPVGALELSLSPSINLTGTLGLSLLGIGVAPDSVTGVVVDTVTFAPTGTSLLAIRHPRQPFPPELVIRTRYLKGVNALAATWTALVKQGALTRYRYAILRWTGETLDFTTLSQSLMTEPIGFPPGWEGITPWMVTTEPRVVQEGLQLAHGMTLYIAVQAQGEDAPWSEVVYSQSILVDSQRPAFQPTPPGVVKGKKQMVLSWTTPESGPSGVERYVVERRRGTKPAWEVLVSAQAPRINEELRMQNEEWGLWYPSSYGHLITGESGNWIIDKPSNSPVNQLTSYPVGQAPALQLPSYQINKLINAPIETKLTPYLTSTSSILPLEDGTSYYRVKAVSGAGEESEPTASTKVVAGLENLPGVINDVSNYPNPFDSRIQSTIIVYVLKQDAPVKIQIFSILGKLVNEWSFASGAPGGQAGANEIVWDGVNGLGEKVASDMYLCVIRAEASGGGARVVRKIGLKH